MKIFELFDKIVINIAKNYQKIFVCFYSIEIKLTQ